MRLIGHRGLGVVVILIALAVAPGTAIAGIPSLPPDVAVDDALTGNEDQVLDVVAPGVMANDVGASGASCVAVTDASALTGEVQVAPDGSFGYTAPGNFNGQTSFAYGLMLLGAEGCPGPFDDTAIVTLTITPINDPPAAAADGFQALVGRTLNVSAPGVLRNDSDIDGDSLTAVKVTNPAHGVVVLAADGSFSYTPTAGYVGFDAFSYRSSDGEATSPARVVTLTVTSVPTPTPAPTPTPTPVPTPTSAPSSTPVPLPSPSAETSPSIEPTAPAPASAPATVGPSATPGPSPEPEPVDEEGGLSLPVLLVLVLLAVMLAFGAAFYVPRLLRAQPAGNEVDDSH